MTDTYRRVLPDLTDADRVGQLVKLARRRPMPDPPQMASARAAARTEWVRVVKRRAWRASVWKLTAAALTVTTVGTAVWFQMRGSSTVAPAIEMATLQRVKGTVFVTGADGRRRAITTGAGLRAGERLETSAASRAAMSIGGVSVRLDSATAAVLDVDGLTLASGAVYVDTGIGTQHSSLRVFTAFGIVRHVGTQFEVRLRDEALQVSVREGTVVVNRADEQWSSHGGERLVIDADRRVERQAVAAFAREWNWVLEVAQPFRLEGATVPRFLDWASRELGLGWDYENPAMRLRVEQIVLHGSVEELTPEEAIAAVLPTCGLSVSREGNRLVIRDGR